MHRWSRTSLLIGFVAFLLAGIFAGRNLATWPARLSYPGQQGSEGVPLVEMLHLREGVAIYARPSQNGFDVAVYGPLFYLLGSRLVNPDKPSYFPLRLLSVAGMLGCAAGCGLLAFWLSRSYLAAFLGPMIFLSYQMVTSFGTLGPSDSVALLLFFFGFLVAYRFRSSRTLLLGAPLMTLGVFYKAQYIAGPVAVVLFLFLTKQYRRAAEFTGLLGVCVLGLFALFQEVVFHDQAFWRHLLVYGASTLSLPRLEQSLLVFAIMLLLPLLFVVEYLRKFPDKMISCYLICAAFLGIFTYCREGSGVQYFFESVLALSALLPVALARKVAQRVIPLDLIVALGLTLIAAQAFGVTPPPRPSDMVKYQAMQSFLRRTVPAHATALGLTAGDLAQAGLETPFPDLYLISLLARRGKLSDGDLVSQIYAQRFSVIVLDVNLEKERDPAWLNYCLTQSLRAAIGRDYELEATLDMPSPEKQRPPERFWVYVPRRAK